VKAAVILAIALFVLSSILAGDARAKILPLNYADRDNAEALSRFGYSTDDMPEVPYCYFTPTPVYDQVVQPVRKDLRATSDDQPIGPMRYILPEEQLK